MSAVATVEEAGLSWLNEDGTTTKIEVFVGCAEMTEPSEDDYRCSVVKTKVHLRGPACPPICTIRYNCKDWAIVSRVIRNAMQRACLSLERVELTSCVEHICIDAYEKNCGCKPGHNPIRSYRNVRAIPTVIESETEIIGDARVCMESIEFCLDRNDLDINPDDIVTYSAKKYRVIKVESRDYPRKPVSIKAETLR